MIIEISLAVAVFIFAILSIFIIKTLITLQHSLKRIDHLTVNIESKLNSFDSTLNTISNIGDLTEVETKYLKEKHHKNAKEFVNNESCSEDLADWLVASIKLGGKFLTRR